MIVGAGHWRDWGGKKKKGTRPPNKNQKKRRSALRKCAFYEGATGRKDLRHKIKCAEADAIQSRRKDTETKKKKQKAGEKTFS